MVSALLKQTVIIDTFIVSSGYLFKEIRFLLGTNLPLWLFSGPKHLGNMGNIAIKAETIIETRDTLPG